MEEYCTLEAMEEVCQDVLCTRFETISIITIYYILRDDTEGNQTVENDHSKTIKTPIPITTHANGEPEIPPITIDDGYNGKTVQKALRDYCTAHISELSNIFCTAFLT